MTSSFGKEIVKHEESQECSCLLAVAWELFDCSWNNYLRDIWESFGIFCSVADLFEGLSDTKLLARKLWVCVEWLQLFVSSEVLWTWHSAPHVHTLYAWQWMGQHNKDINRKAKECFWGHFDILWVRFCFAPELPFCSNGQKVDCWPMLGHKRLAETSLGVHEGNRFLWPLEALGAQRPTNLENRTQHTLAYANQALDGKAFAQGSRLLVSCQQIEKGPGDDSEGSVQTQLQPKERWGILRQMFTVDSNSC